MVITAFCAKKRAGKDTLGEYLIKNHGYQRYSFADPLKRGCMEMFGFNEEQMWGDLKEVVDERWGITPREVLQIMGTNLLQFDVHEHTDKLNHIGREIWVHRFKLWVKEQKEKYESKKNIWHNETKNNSNVISYNDALMMPKPLKIVITDVRFEHEVKAIKEMGGTIYKIIRPSLKSEDTHLSETEIDSLKEDILIFNDSSKEDLYKKMEDLIKHT